MKFLDPLVCIEVLMVWDSTGHIKINTRSKCGYDVVVESDEDDTQ